MRSTITTALATGVAAAVALVVPATATAPTADLQPQGLVTLGYPEQPGKIRPRKPLADILLAAEVER